MVPRPSGRTAAREAGFTLTEMMIVLVIIGVMATVAMPSLTRDKRLVEAREFASEVARDLQRARVQAVSSRLPVRAYVFRDRVEFRSATPGATPGAAPTAPTLATPIGNIVSAKSDVSIFAVTAVQTPPGAQVLNTVAPAEIEFNGTGGAQFVGQPASANLFVWVRHNGLAAGAPTRDYRINISTLTGHVRLAEAW